MVTNPEKPKMPRPPSAEARDYLVTVLEWCEGRHVAYLRDVKRWHRREATAWTLAKIAERKGWVACTRWLLDLAKRFRIESSPGGREVTSGDTFGGCGA